MRIDLEDVETRTSHAVRMFWDTHAAATERQKLNGVLDQGERAGVTSGKNMDSFVTLIADLVIAAIELKSQTGPSFGNNFNNRTKEAIGSAVDLWTAYGEGVLGDQPTPFVGWLTHVEEAPESVRAVRVAEPHFAVFPEMSDMTYLERYNNLCRRLVLEKPTPGQRSSSLPGKVGCEASTVGSAKLTSFKRSSLLLRHISQQRLRCSGSVATLANLTDDCARNG